MLLTLLSNQTAGAVTLLPPLTVNTNVFYAPTISAEYILAPALFTNTNTFYPADVAPGVITLDPAIYINTNIIYLPTVTNQSAQLVGGGGGEDSSSSRPRKTKSRRKTSGFANERAIFEASLSSKVVKSADVLTESKIASARKTAKSLSSYLNEQGTADALQKQLSKLLAQLSVKSANDENDDSLNADLIAATNEIQEFLDDEQEAIQILLLDQESDDALLLMAMGL